jgi:hypothetical protein
MSVVIPAITIWQPWATLITEGFKPYEFRSRKPPAPLIGKRVAIHAGARPVRRSEINGLINDLVNDWRGTGLVETGQLMDLLEKVFNEPTILPLRSVVCTALLGEPLRDAELAAAIGVSHVNDSDRDAHSNWGWPLTEIRRVEPFQPARGMQAIGWPWRVPEGVAL